MRTYGRVTNADGSQSWVEASTDPNTGDNSLVYLVTLIQCLKLNLGESPFWANYGIPAQQSVLQQVFPDYYVILTQQNFSGYFASLQIAKLSGPEPAYRISVTTNQGVNLSEDVPIPS
jgi:hypothetical protein